MTEMGRKKDMALEGASVPVEGVPPPPTASESQDALAALVAQLKAALARAKDRLPPELRGNAFLVESVVNSELDKANFGAWRAQIVTEFVALIQSGKSEAPHDPTELA